MDTIEFGSLYFEDGAWPVGSICGSGRFSLGDTELSKEIPWIAANGLLFSAQNICKNIGWKDLEMQNLIVGKKIKIDGLPFKCRIPVISDNCLEDDEWKQLQEAINSSAESDLHWEDSQFWAQKKDVAGMEGRALIGGSHANYQVSVSSRTKNSRTSFRPVLEPLRTCRIETVRQAGGEDVAAIVPGGLIRGKMVDVSDFDIFLEPNAWTKKIVGMNRWAVKVPDGALAVSKDAILHFFFV